MVEFYCSDWGKFKQWKPVKEHMELEEFIKDFMHEEYRVFDADVCGDETVEIAVQYEDRTKYYKATYSWWIETRDGRWLEDDVEVYEISEEDVKFKFPVVERDWLMIGSTYLYENQERNGG